MKPEDIVEYFNFLDGLRESGLVNMFGCAPYLQESFDLDKREARKIAVQWMQTFSSNETVEARAAKAKLD